MEAAPGSQAGGTQPTLATQPLGSAIDAHQDNDQQGARDQEMIDALVNAPPGSAVVLLRAAQPPAEGAGGLEGEEADPNDEPGLEEQQAHQMEGAQEDLMRADGDEGGQHAAAVLAAPAAPVPTTSLMTGAVSDQTLMPPPPLKQVQAQQAVLEQQQQQEYKASGAASTAAAAPPAAEAPKSGSGTFTTAGERSKGEAYTSEV